MAKLVGTLSFKNISFIAVVIFWLILYRFLRDAQQETRTQQHRYRRIHPGSAHLVLSKNTNSVLKSGTPIHAMFGGEVYALALDRKHEEGRVPPFAPPILIKEMNFDLLPGIMDDVFVGKVYTLAESYRSAVAVYGSLPPPKNKTVKHHLHYKFTVLTKADTLPEFSAVGVYDDRQIKHYNWTKPPVNLPDYKIWFIHQMKTLSNCTDSQCSELHVLQRIIGCELEKCPNGTANLRAFDEYGFDGEDFIAFNSDTLQWIAKNPKAKETKIKWDQQTERNQFLQHFLKNCINWISTFNNTNTTPPDVHVFARKVPDDHSRLNLSCLTTGFYPRDIEMYISLDRTVLENQIFSGIRPNDNETFQMRSSVKIDRNYKGSYDCFVIHSSLTEPVSVEWDGKCVDCETGSPRPVRAVRGVVVPVPVLVLTVIGYFICKRKRSNEQSRISVCTQGQEENAIMMTETCNYFLQTQANGNELGNGQLLQ